jgi:hypothetical protein
VYLPNASHAVVERGKMSDYLLAFDHPEGASKAAFFSRFGFTADDWQILAEALIFHAATHQVSFISESKFGTKFQIDGQVFCPDGRSPFIRAIWIIDADNDTPRLVTAYPL